METYQVLDLEMSRLREIQRWQASAASKVDLCFDQLVYKLCEIIYTFYKCFAARELLDPSFILACDDGDRYSVKPMRFKEIFKLRRVKLLGRTIDLRSLITQRMNKFFRENIDFLFERFESQGLCTIVELQQILDIVKRTHHLLLEDLKLDSFTLMLDEMQENLSLVSFSSRVASQRTKFMQTAVWLGLVPGIDGQIKQATEGSSPIVNLFKSATTAILSDPTCQHPSSFCTMAKQAETADLLLKATLSTGSVLDYALAFTSAALDKHYSKWNSTPKTGFIDITTAKDFYRVFSGLQFEYLEETVLDPSNKYEVLGDSVAWAGCTIIYLLGQQLHFELFDFSYQFLNVAEVEGATILQNQSSDRAKNANYLQGYANLLEAMKKARRLNNHVFSMLKARCPLEDKVACAIKQSGAPLHRVRFVNTVSAFETLPQKCV